MRGVIAAPIKAGFRGNGVRLSTHVYNTDDDVVVEEPIEHSDPETMMQEFNDRFEARFRRMEHLMAERGQDPRDLTLDEMEALWQEAKAQLRKEAAE